MLDGWAKDEEKRLSGWVKDARVTAVEASYLDDDIRGHKYDVYTMNETAAAGSAPYPVINIHGGGLMYGYKEGEAPYCYEIVKRGFKVYNLNYRTAYDDADLIGMLRDVSAAFEKIFKEEEAAYVTGDSAGAFLAALVIMIGKSDRLKNLFGVNAPDVNVKAAAFISGMMTALDKNLGFAALRKICFEKGYAKKPYAKCLDFSSLDEISLLPPCYLATGDDDALRKMTLDFKSTLDNHNVPNFLRYYKKEKGKKLGHVFAVNYWNLPESQLQIDEMCNFFGSVSCA